MATVTTPKADSEPPWTSKYPPGVPHRLAIPPTLLTDAVEAVVGRYGERTALAYYGARWTYRRLWAESGRFAAALAGAGVHEGDRVALYLPNCPAYPIALLGILRAGAIAVQLSPLYREHELAELLGDSTPKALVTLEILYPQLTAPTIGFRPSTVFVGRFREFYPVWKRPFVNRVLRRSGYPTAVPRGPTIVPWRHALRAAGQPPRAKGDPATTVAVLQYTGGTTGTPKAAMLTHRNLLANVTQANAWNTTKEPGKEVLLASIPFFHVYGLTAALLLGLVEGATIVIQTRPEVGELLRLIDRHHPTQFPGVPALYQAFVKRPDLGRYRIRSIKFCVSGSAPLPVEVARAFEQATGANLVEGYGLTEASPVTHVNPVQGERRPGSIGLPLPETDQKLVEPGTFAALKDPSGEGELAVRGPQVMLGYYRRPGETAEVLQDGWLRTGDIARIEPDGYVYVVDRWKDLINVGGLKVYPREVEEVLLAHPGVADAAVLGVPDTQLGEVPRAFVVRRAGASPTESELVDFVRAHLAHYKAPRVVEFRDTLPRSGVQKVLRRALRAETLGRLPTGSRSPAPISPRGE